MNSILIGKVETDPLIHYGGIFNTFEMMLFLSFVSFLIFLPFIKNGGLRNLLFFVAYLMPLLNVYYRNNHQFIGGVFIGHLFFIGGIILISSITYLGFERVNEGVLSRTNKILPLIIIFLFIIRAIFVFGSRPTDSGIFSGIGGILYFNKSSMFRDYWGVVSIGSRYGPMLYLAYLPFVPIAYITKHLLWGDALTSWNSVSDVPLAVATSYTGALFYEGLIILILIRSFKRYGYFAALFYLLNPLNSLGISVNANELPQMALFLTAIYTLKRPARSALFFTLSSLMKLYPLISSIPFILNFKGGERKRFIIYFFIFFMIGFGYWLFEASLAPPELKTNPVRDIIFYQRDPGPYHSLWHFTDIIFGRTVTFVILSAIILILLTMGCFLWIKEKDSKYIFLKLSVLLTSIIIIINRSPHPGYYYFLQTLFLYLFLSVQEEAVDKIIN